MKLDRHNMILGQRLRAGLKEIKDDQVIMISDLLNTFEDALAEVGNPLTVKLAEDETKQEFVLMFGRVGEK